MESGKESLYVDTGYETTEIWEMGFQAKCFANVVCASTTTVCAVVTLLFVCLFLICLLFYSVNIVINVF